MKAKRRNRTGQGERLLEMQESGESRLPCCALDFKEELIVFPHLGCVFLSFNIHTLSFPPLFLFFSSSSYIFDVIIGF